jgi:preprotein translocase subunit SecD
MQKKISESLVIFICTLYVLSSLYLLSNLYEEEPAVQIAPAYARDDIKIDETVQDTVETTLEKANIPFIPINVDRDRTSKQLLVRFKETDTQFKAYSLLRDTLSEYVVAQNLAPTAPYWLRALSAVPIYLGLDSRGVVHFLMQVDMETAIRQDEETYVNELRSLFRENKLRYKGINRVTQEGGGILVAFSQLEIRDKAKKLVEKQYNDLVITEQQRADEYRLYMTFSEQALIENRKNAVEQNIITLRNRVNELGVLKPVIQRQGDGRIVVQLPGVRNTARAKEILGATATLEFRMTEGTRGKWFQVERTKRLPINARLYHERNGDPVLLKRRIIATGDQIMDAAATIDQQSGQPATTVRLDSQGGKRMLQTTRKNVGKPMAVIFIEYHIETKIIDGKKVTTRRKTEEVINVATIREEFSRNFQITGLKSSEANNLALLLRAGALKAPMEIVEERTIMHWDR